ncbi:MAG TPA: 16S rRNA (guanine(527)-N(7))-methyltransferase RsmG [Gammaproteobacteria bacterium]|nr:16S rRNA (guanine(527)-N(7))-methyltransferase RsmG [Gammaproteobacteria bacterium]
MKSIQEVLQKLTIPCSDRSITQFQDYFKYLHQWNKVHNLTSIPEGNKSIIIHLYDSLSLYPHVKNHHHIMDVGSGAGLPGVLLAIAQPDLELTLVECSHKRCAFLRHVRHKLGLKNVLIINKRVESLPPSLSYDLVLTRAFAPLNTQWRYIEHLLDENAYILAMKGKIQPEEIVRSTQHIYAIIKLPPTAEIHHRHLIKLKKKPAVSRGTK